MKTYHMAGKVNQRGGVSALCFAKPKAIDLTRALWTNRKEAVTCKKCLAILTQKPLGKCCYGGLKTKDDCASCGAWEEVSNAKVSGCAPLSNVG